MYVITASLINPFRVRFITVRLPVSGDVRWSGTAWGTEETQAKSVLRAEILLLSILCGVRQLSP